MKKLNLLIILSAILYSTTIMPAKNPDEPNPNKRTAQQSGQEESSAEKQRVEELTSAPASSSPVIESTQEERNNLWDAIAYDDNEGLEVVISHLNKFPQDIKLISNDIDEAEDEAITLLMHAIFNDSFDIFQEILKRAPDHIINALDAYGNTALMYAVQKKDSRFTHKLLERRASINDKNGEERTALMLACMYMKYESIKEILKVAYENIDINAQDDSVNTALTYLISNFTKNWRYTLNDPESFDKNTDILNKPQQKKAALTLIRLLIGKGAAINNPEGINPLSLAASIGAYDVVELLVQAGADITITDMNGDTPLARAQNELNTIIQNGPINGQREYDRLAQGYSRIIQILSDPSEYKAGRQSAIKRSLIETGNIKDITTIMGEYITGPNDPAQIFINDIKKALQTDDILSLLETLENHPSAPYVTDEAEDTPLLLAIKWEKPAAVEIILQIFKQQIEKVEDRHEKIYLIAEQEEQFDKARTLAHALGNKEVIELIDQYTSESTEPLNLLPQDFIELLTQGGKHALEAIEYEIRYHHPEYLYAVDQDGNTPLMIAAKHGHTMTVQTLLEFNKDNKKLRNKAGKTAVQLAQESLALADEPARQQRLQDIIAMLNN